MGNRCFNYYINGQASLEHFLPFAASKVTYQLEPKVNFLSLIVITLKLLTGTVEAIETILVFSILRWFLMLVLLGLFKNCHEIRMMGLWLFLD